MPQLETLLTACVSVLMPCRTPGPYLKEAVCSVLSQPECLELVVFYCGSPDCDLTALEALATADSRLRILIHPPASPSFALNQAFRVARGTLITCLKADDLFPSGSLARAVAALNGHPDWLMVYGDCEVFDICTGLSQRYSIPPDSFESDGFPPHCFLCRPSVLFRRSMVLLLEASDSHWSTACKLEYWLRVFAAFPYRIGYLPHLQGRTRLQRATNTNWQRAQPTMEFTQLLSRRFVCPKASRLHSVPLEMQSDLSMLPEQVGVDDHLMSLFELANHSVTAAALSQFQHIWRSGVPATSTSSVRFRWKPSGFLGVPPSVIPFQERQFGVNLIGHALEVFGIGEDVRMAARALQAADVPCCVIHHPAGNGSACSDSTLEPLLCDDPAGGPYAFNLVCLAAPIQARWLRQNGCDPLRERYTLSSWPWETQKWPEAWMPLLDVADELWPSSRFTAAALAGPAADIGRPLQVMPMAAEIAEPERFFGASGRAATRARHGLPGESVLFGYGFDLKSTAIRKNPMAALEAFQLAFPLSHLPATYGRECNDHPLSEQVALLIKTFPPQGFSAEWHWLQARAAEDSRIVLIAESLPREELLALYGCCDVFLSLHRSEGFGRGMAEALQLGVDVIATDFGGNTDFCTGPLAHPVRWRSAPIPRGAYPYADGHSWAEPDLEHAAELCRQVAERRLSRDIRGYPVADDSSRDPAMLASYRERFSFASVGARYRARLDELWADRESLGKRLRWRADRSPVGW